ncbi:MAG TPA: hypothetical protein VFM18_19240 [Methanosarcina sp.]|nr:hypothetical protein [Methanosarcina sp.]
MDLDDLIKRQDATFKRITSLPSRYKPDLMRLDTNAYDIRAEISKEAIRCRRTGRPSIRYNELMVQLTEVIELMEEYLTFASLLS